MLKQLREMREREREARQLAEQQLAEERKQMDEAHDIALQMLAEIVNEFREERRLAAEERRQNAAIRQALLVDTIVRLTQPGNRQAEGRD